MATLDAPLSHAELAAMLAEDERMALSFRDSMLADEQAAQDHAERIAKLPEARRRFL